MGEEKRRKDELNRMTPGDFMRTLTEAQKKKAVKEFQGQKKKYEKYIKTASSSNGGGSKDNKDNGKQDNGKKAAKDNGTSETKDSPKKESDPKVEDKGSDSVSIQKTGKFTVLEAPT